MPTQNKSSFGKSIEEIAHILMRRAGMTDLSHPLTPTPLIPLQVAPIVDQASKTALFFPQEHPVIA